MFLMILTQVFQHSNEEEQPNIVREVKETTLEPESPPATPVKPLEMGVASRKEKKHIEDKVTVKVSDYPKWDGKQNTWKGFYLNFKATASLAQLDHLLVMDGDDIDLCDEEIKHDSSQLYNILVLCTSKGLAANKVSKYDTNKNGIKAWNDLCEVCELGGDPTSMTT